MDYIPGGSVERLLEKFAFPETVIRRYTVQILKGLQYLHDNNIIHRDIKAGNILVDEHGMMTHFVMHHVRQNILGRFWLFHRIVSICKASQNNYWHTQLYGTRSDTRSRIYAVCKMKDAIFFTICRAADIWSLGCTVIEMFSRKPPWHHVLSNFENAFAFFDWLMKEKPVLEIPKNMSNVAKEFLSLCFKRYVIFYWILNVALLGRLVIVLRLPIYCNTHLLPILMPVMIRTVVSITMPPMHPLQRQHPILHQVPQ